ncbi:MAG: hypothetical protein K2Y42_06180 [Hyphomicrobium sp.]|uniref:hypothetical protein n=1 Tax=Hyphomicrobium sp. TaxID=82 RepID=UPI0025B88BCD|nr:hypothetical protein [Hyphomicrobium sp.]MBX9862324.1 hypothetical protein [Hyphomicrobium sp.]
MHPDVRNGFAVALERKLGAMSAADLERHVEHYATITALHEAAHAVVHVKSGVRLVSVDILPNEHGVGYTLPEEGMTDAQAAVGSFAGCIGEVLTGDIATFVEATDHDVGQGVFSCFNLCGGTLGSEVDAEELMACVMREWDRTVVLIMEPVTFGGLYKVAGALLANGKLDHEQVEAVMALVDRPDSNLAKIFRVTKENLASVRRMVPLVAGRWLSEDKRRLRDGAFQVETT